MATAFLKKLAQLNRGECQHCGAAIHWSSTKRKWVAHRTTRRGTVHEVWKCGNDPAFPVRAHAPMRSAS